jgi:hypothetical protein
MSGDAGKDPLIAPLNLGPYLNAIYQEDRKHDEALLLRHLDGRRRDGERERRRPTQSCN